MPKKRKQIDVMYQDGTRGKAIATGNNAAWVCNCGNEQLLLGRADPDNATNTPAWVECPACHRRFSVSSGGAGQQDAMEVSEITTA
ncbi:hypothetical protein SAMN04488540_13310 [Ferrimonas sediminum]|uniref:Uncharacterized protein n=1 Tax=Ferrimonas sediminum TaxID=718193 RepID=A0A1G9BQC2_9GAMM|nr:hypothetical protein [Ferrimonas sediminum]SDK41699.1 hypothetical protein SAMN04488540_13310 [Ferrimonas sediminum]